MIVADFIALLQQQPAHLPVIISRPAQQEQDHAEPTSIEIRKMVVDHRGDYSLPYTKEEQIRAYNCVVIE